MMKVLVLVEEHNGSLKRSSCEAITAANQLTSSDNITAIAVNSSESALKSAGKYGASQVVNANENSIKGEAPAIAKIVSDYATQNSFDTVVFPADSLGKEVAPRVSVKLEAGYISDCVGLEVNGADLVATKPVYAGKAQAKVKINTSTKVLSLRPNVFTAKVIAEGTEANYTEITPSLDDISKAVKITNISVNDGKLDVAEADIVVSGGRGLKEPENFNLVENLASALGGAVGASRAVVDAGWRPHSEQVGQTGKTVSPSLYVACAISGAVQHLAGMSSSKFIVAINKDADAPIFKITDYGIVGDVFEVLPKLTEKIKARN